MAHNFYVISGGPGAGKTTLLDALALRGYPCIPEVARKIISEQLQHYGTALPWGDRALYTQLMLERSVASYRETAGKYATNQPVFFDRGILDTLCYATLTGSGISQTMEQYARLYSYNPKVFMLPPWETIYHTDTERKQNWKEAVSTYDQMIKTYQQYGYTIIEVPKDTVENRVAFILKHILKN